MEQNYFEVLGVTPQATQPEIDAAYEKRRADLARDADALRRLDEAYATLSLSYRRAAYLQQLAAEGRTTQGTAGSEQTKGSKQTRTATAPTIPASKEAAEVTARILLTRAGLTSGQLLGRYRIAELLGEGGMARVYKAFDTRLERYVAIKVIGLGLPLSGSALERFQREAKGLAQLAHPNIVKVLDFGEQEGLPYLVMEFIPGGTLKDRLGKPIPYGQAAALLSPIARALEYAHQKKIIHRDVKPSNILITESGQPMLSDFGLAKVLEDSRPDLTSTGTVLGTPEYMAPEQVLSGTVDGRTDVYGLGIVLYEMLKGHTPFQADTPIAVLIKQANEPVPPLALPGAKTRESANAVLLKALAKRPENRFPTMGDFADALDLLAQGEKRPITAATLEKPGSGRISAPAALPTLETRKTGRLPLLPLGVLLGLVVVLLGAFALIHYVSFPRPARPSAAIAASATIPGPTPAPTSISGAMSVTQAPPGTVSSLFALAAAAKQEGALNIIGLPHDWCDYGNMISQFGLKYGLIINEINPTASSADELQAIIANRGNPGAQGPDVIDIALPFGPQAVSQELIAPYEVATWDTIPAGEKDPMGYWYADYYGVIAFEVNGNLVKDPPQDWSDLQKPEYHRMIALSGDPRSNNTALQAVFAAGLSAASGEVPSAGQAGLNFFAQLNKTGNLLPIAGDRGTVASGLTPILLTWDYQSLADNAALGGNPPIVTVIPKTGVVAGYYVQAINAYAPHHSAAELWMEYLYSDEGQLTWLRGFCHPIRYNDLVQRNMIPNDLVARLPSAALYANAFFPSEAQQAAHNAVITNGWDTFVGVDVK